MHSLLAPLDFDLAFVKEKYWDFWSGKEARTNPEEFEEVKRQEVRAMMENLSGDTRSTGLEGLQVWVVLTLAWLRWQCMTLNNIRRRRRTIGGLKLQSGPFETP